MMQERGILQQVRGTSSSGPSVGHQAQIGHKGTCNDPPIQVQGEHSYLTVSRVLRGVPLLNSSPTLSAPER